MSYENNAWGGICLGIAIGLTIGLGIVYYITQT